MKLYFLLLVVLVVIFLFNKTSDRSEQFCTYSTGCKTWMPWWRRKCHNSELTENRMWWGW